MNRYLMIAIGLSLLVGCLKTRAELDAEETGHVEQTQTVAQQQTQQRAKSTPAPVRIAQNQSDSEEYDEQMREMAGRIDTVENAVAQANANRQSEKEAIGQQKAAIDQKFQAYEEALKKLEAQVASLNDEVTRLKTPPPPPPEPVAPVSAKAVNEVGDEQFAAKKWKEAIVSFQKYREANPKGKKFADVTYKIGVCFQELGMKDEARAFLEEVTAKFPTSKEAKKANGRLKTLR